MAGTTRFDPDRVGLLALGWASVVAQATLLREAMATLGGSELAWGVVMALWLVGMGVGARVGTHVGSVRLARVLPVILLGLTACGVVLLRANPTLVGTTGGEVVTTLYAGWWWLLSILPAAMAGGLAFPVLVEPLGGRGPGEGYALDAAGALAGGAVLTYVLAPWGTAAILCVTTGMAVTAALVPVSRLAAAAAAFTCLAITPPAGDLLARLTWHWSGRPGELRAWAETRQQRLEISSGPPYALYSDGRLVASYPDPYTTVPRTHLMMLLHPDPDRVLAVGTLVDGAVATVLEHPVSCLRIIEMDRRLPRLLTSWYGEGVAAALRDDRVELVAGDPVRALSRPGTWDMVVLSDGDPTTVRRNATRTLELFGACRQRLEPDGVLVVPVGVSDTYLGGVGGELLAVLTSTLRTVFAHLVAVPGERILLVAGGPDASLELDPDRLRQRWIERGIEDPRFPPEMVDLLVDPSRARSLADTVERAHARVNTLDRPRAVLLAAGLEEARARHGLLRLVRRLADLPVRRLILSVAVVAVLLAILAGAGRAPRSAPAAVIGACSMGWWLLLMAAWQATRGSVYAQVGALTAVFMAGLAGGAAVALRWPRPLRRLPFVLLAGTALSGSIALGASVRWPSLAIPLLLVAGGVLTGAAFPGTAELVACGRPRRGAGVAFAADEAGAAVAALLVGVVALPWAGISATATGLAILELAAVPVVLAASRRQAPPPGTETGTGDGLP